MTDHPEIIIAVLVGLAALGVGIGVLSLRGRRKCRRLCALAAQAADQGRSEEALGLLLAAEQAWAFNAHDGSRSSNLSDLKDFSGILDEFARLGVKTADDAPWAHIRRSVADLRNLLSDRSNFGIDGRMMKREAAVQWSQLSGEFAALRQALRRAVQDLRMNAERGSAPNDAPATPRADSRVTEGPSSVN
ncbi:MAG: hypothetical protein HZA90_02975 [Verrucomicrobia bacterium]|nr:hypothetical protein [Verrucomicrobiota bacterium]